MGTRGQVVLAVGLAATGIMPVALPTQARAQFFDPPVLRPPNEVPSVPQLQGAPGSSNGANSRPGAVGAEGTDAPVVATSRRARPGPCHTTLAPGQGALALTARFGRDLPMINGGLHWRVFRVEQNGTPRLVKEDKTPAPTFALPEGSYVVSAAFGLASATKVVQVRSENAKEVFELPAGGLRIEGRVGDARIPHGQITFELYKGSQFEPGDKRPIATAIMTGDVMLVPEGTYYIVSNYGDANSTVRSDIRVQAGKLADTTVNHRAAIITLKLVNDRGGEARANTQWSVLTPGGDVIKESIGAFPRVILAEGEYRAIARNDNRTYEGAFRVLNGVDSEVELIAR